MEKSVLSNSGKTSKVSNDALVVGIEVKKGVRWKIFDDETSLMEKKLL